MDSEAVLRIYSPDIQEAAMAAFNADLPEGQALYQILPSYFTDQVLLAIANAIFNERKRCVEIAARFRETTVDGREELVSDLKSGPVKNETGT